VENGTVFHYSKTTAWKPNPILESLQNSDLSHI